MATNVHALVGPYSLDALDRPERQQFERHLGTCDVCWNDVLASMAAARRLDAIRPSVNP